jgi:eukaryotic-like serine/threonine-protein kinase
VQPDALPVPLPTSLLEGASRRRSGVRALRSLSGAEGETPAPRSEEKRRPPADLRMLPRKLGRYTLFDHIGRGGMADIFLAQSRTELGASRLVVIKEVLPSLSWSSEFAEMLVGEAKLAAHLSHANVVKVEDLGREDESLYIAMEYVEGIDLRELLRGCARRKLALPVEFSLRIVIEVLKGLDHAHRARGEGGARLGLVHRDVSPSNVLLSFEGEVKVCDFGIARANPLVEDLREEAIVGKAGYMSPEHARGEGLDARADVFATGIILWELLAGRRLYKAPEGGRLIDVARRAEVPALEERGLSDEAALHSIVTRALRSDREDRYATAAAMLSDLEDYAARARMMASPIRFGEWLMENFGRELVRQRRARTLVLAALSRGPAAVIEPIREVEDDVTPTSFPVVLRADAIEERGAIEPSPPPSSYMPSKWTRAPLSAPSLDAQPAGAGARLFVYAMAIAAAAFAVLWFMSAS